MRPRRRWAAAAEGWAWRAWRWWRTRAATWKSRRKAEAAAQRRSWLRCSGKLNTRRGRPRLRKPSSWRPSCRWPAAAAAAAAAREGRSRCACGRWTVCGFWRRRVAASRGLKQPCGRRRAARCRRPAAGKWVRPRWGSRRCAAAFCCLCGTAKTTRPLKARAAGPRRSWRGLAAGRKRRTWTAKRAHGWGGGEGPWTNKRLGEGGRGRGGRRFPRVRSLDFCWICLSHTHTWYLSLRSLPIHSI